MDQSRSHYNTNIHPSILRYNSRMIFGDVYNIKNDNQCQTEHDLLVSLFQVCPCNIKAILGTKALYSSLC